MIVSKVVGCFLVWLVFVGQTSAFLQDKCMGLDPIQAVQSAKSINSLIQEYPALAKKAPSLCKAAGKVAEQGLAEIEENPALVCASIYFGSKLLSAYFLIKDANIQLMKAKFHLDELETIDMEAEILPDLEYFDTVIREGENSKSVCAGFCSPQVESFSKAIKYLQGERKKLEKTLPIELPHASRFSLGVIPWIPYGIGYYLFGESQLTYQQSMAINEVLLLAREKALNTENMLRQAKAEIDTACRDLYA